MVKGRGNAHSDQAKMEQIITEFFAKSLHIILESRTPYMSSRNFSGEQAMSSPSSSCSSSSSVRPRDKWFNLALRECPAALDKLDLWHQSNLESLVVDVILVQQPFEGDPISCSSKRGIVRKLSFKEGNPDWSTDQGELGYGAKNEQIIERWVVQYESVRTKCSSGSRRSSNNLLHILYKKSILLLRSLYATVRLLPAYKFFCALNSSGKICSYTLAHRVSSFVELFTRGEEAEMQQFKFTPVDTSCGRLCVSVLYRSSLVDVSSEVSNSMSSRVIPDYVGSPLADRYKRIPSFPVARSLGYPSSSPYSRRQSKSFDHYGTSLTLSELSASVFTPSSRRYPPNSLPPHSLEASPVYKKDTNFDEYFPFPTFSPSPSPSPSPPIYARGTHPRKALFHSGSAPVCISAAKFSTSPALIKQSDTGQTDKNTGLIQNSAAVKKLFSLGKDDVRKYSGVNLSSSSSPRVTLSRCFSRSVQDDFDDSEFDCPFDLEYVDMTDPASRPNSFDQKGHPCHPPEPGGQFLIRKSQDADVGALVYMLKKASPLHQDLSSLINSSSASRPKTCSGIIQERNHIHEASAVQDTASLRVVMAKTTADAFKELQGYRETKNLLLSQGSKSHTLANCTFTAEPHDTPSLTFVGSKTTTDECKEPCGVREAINLSPSQGGKSETLAYRASAAENVSETRTDFRA